MYTQNGQKQQQLMAQLSIFLAVGEYHLSSHNSIVLLYSMSIFYHQTTALSAMCWEGEKNARSYYYYYCADLVNCTVLYGNGKEVQWEFVGHWKNTLIILAVMPIVIITIQIPNSKNFGFLPCPINSWYSKLHFLSFLKHCERAGQGR